LFFNHIPNNYEYVENPDSIITSGNFNSFLDSPQNYEKPINEHYTSKKLEIKSKPLINIFPNPATDKLVVNINVKFITKFMVNLYDLHSKLILSDIFNADINNNSKEFNVKHLVNGYYTINIISEDIMFKDRFVVIN